MNAKYSVFYSMAALALLARCSTTPPATITVRVPVPVACTQAVPDRPLLSIDTMSPDLPLDVQARNMRADHDDRDGYEARLRAALEACRRIGAP